MHLCPPFHHLNGDGRDGRGFPTIQPSESEGSMNVTQRVWHVSLGIWGTQVLRSWAYKMHEETKERPVSPWLYHFLLRKDSVSHWPHEGYWELSDSSPRWQLGQVIRRQWKGQATKYSEVEGKMRSVLQKKNGACKETRDPHGRNNQR